MLFRALIPAAAVLLAACSGPAEAPAGESVIEVKDAFVIKPAAGRDVAGGGLMAYVTGAPVELVGASTDIADRVEKLTGDTGPFRAAARELLALSAWKAGDIETARQWISALEDDAETPADVSRRVSILSDVIRSSNGEAKADSEGNNQ